MREAYSDRRPSLLGRLRAWLVRGRDRSATRAFTARKSPREVGKPPPSVTVQPPPRPGVHVHEERLRRPSQRVALSPSQALHLASRGQTEAPAAAEERPEETPEQGS